jgi:hypothetical protein
LSNQTWYAGVVPPGAKISISTRPLVAVALVTSAVTATSPPAATEDGATDAVVVNVGPGVGAAVGGVDGDAAALPVGTGEPGGAVAPGVAGGGVDTATCWVTANDAALTFEA